MTKFADALFTDLMRQHRSTLESMGRAGTHDVVIRPLTGDRPPRPRRRLPSWLTPVAAAVAVLLAVGLAAGLGGLFTGKSRPAGQVNAATSQTAYVFNWATGTLRSINPATGTLGHPIKVGPGSLSRTAKNMISPDGKTDYVVYTTNFKTWVLRPVSLVTGVAGKPIPIGDSTDVAVTPDGKTAYVGYSTVLHKAGRGYTEGPGSVRSVSLTTGTVSKPIVRGAGYPGIAITPDGATAYVAFPGSGTVTPISTATSTPGPVIAVPGAQRIVITAGGGTADVISRTNTVTPISTVTGQPGQPVKTRYTQGALNIAPDGRTEYVTSGGSTEVTPVSLVSGRAAAPIKLNGAGNMVFTPDSKTAYYVNVIYPRVTPVSVATNTAGAPIKLTSFALYIAISPDGKTVYAYTNNSFEQTVTPVSTATGKPDKPIMVRGQNIGVIVPGGSLP